MEKDEEEFEYIKMLNNFFFCQFTTSKVALDTAIPHCY